MELGDDGIRVNAILPGGVDGDRLQNVLRHRAEAENKSLEEMRAIIMTNQSLKYFVDPAAIAALAVFLASDAAKSISGQIFPIDGDMQRN
jgi:NAD(P)-dependent dehydrogenase (short-subunit alcohol dehydrogenase family)